MDQPAQPQILSEEEFNLLTAEEKLSYLARHILLRAAALPEQTAPDKDTTPRPIKPPE